MLLSFMKSAVTEYGQAETFAIIELMQGRPVPSIEDEYGPSCLGHLVTLGVVSPMRTVQPDSKVLTLFKQAENESWKGTPKFVLPRAPVTYASSLPLPSASVLTPKKDGHVSPETWPGEAHASALPSASSSKSKNKSARAHAGNVGTLTTASVAADFLAFCQTEKEATDLQVMVGEWEKEAARPEPVSHLVESNWKRKARDINALTTEVGELTHPADRTEAVADFLAWIFDKHYSSNTVVRFRKFARETARLGKRLQDLTHWSGHFQLIDLAKWYLEDRKMHDRWSFSRFVAFVDDRCDQMIKDRDRWIATTNATASSRIA